MSTSLLWIVGIIVVTPIAWLIVSLFLSYTLTPERTGRDYLKRKARKLGIDVWAIPQVVFDEIVAQEILGAKRLAETDRPEWKNWRANLVRGLDEQALHLVRLLAGERGWGGSYHVHSVLEKHGLLEEDVE